MRKTLITITIIALITSCSKNDNISLVSSNIKTDKTYVLDYESAYITGFNIPSKLKDSIEYFDLTFRMKDFDSKVLYYMVYYQNESYKFNEINENEEYNVLSSENFYGCIENYAFDSIIVDNVDSMFFNAKIKISGNPRNEQKYYGKNWHSSVVSNTDIKNRISKIKKDKKWMQSIKDKAIKNKRSLDEQLYREAKWLLSKNPNNKWQRNPRVGNYSLLVVVTDKKGLDNLPLYIKDISKTKENKHINPYYYFLYGKNKSKYNTLLIENFINVKAKIPLENGIFINYSSKRFDGKDYYNKYVNDSDTLYTNATFQYHGTERVKTESVMNIPVHTDFFGKGYTKKEYEDNRKKYDSLRIETFFTNSVYPGRTIGYDEQKKALWFKNPANSENEFKKENVGIKSRHGFTYGKYTFKIKMAELLTKDNVWTGLTNAIWMIGESGEEWNSRRICKKGGYMPYYGAKKGETRVPYITYSEIDFEILKAAEVWPRYSYPDHKEREDPKSHADKVMIACTNWDMACLEPDSFATGLKHITYKNDTFNIHRWDEYYNALTSKVPAKDDELFGGEFYYFQLEWKPTEIIWRVGPDKENLRVVGYMNDDVTSIPNNQMLIIITQEYHFSKWWPKSPFNQEDIPFNIDELKGYLYSVEIE